MSAALWVVKLEGPAVVADRAGSVSSLALEVAGALARRAEYHRATGALNHLSLSDPVAAELETALRALSVVVSETAYNAQPGARQMPPQEVVDAVERARELHDQMSDHIDIADWVALLNGALNFFPDPEALNRQLSTTVEQLLSSCRQALDARSDHC
ncbi:hypothetical protein [Streptomyces sp. NPDC002640]